MIRKYHFLFVFIGISLLNCATSKNSSGTGDSLEAKNLLLFGRFGFTTDQSLELISSGAHFGFSFRGKECAIYASLPQWLDHNYLQFELDGVYQRRVRISKQSTQPVVISAATEGKHVIWIYKATEAHTGAVYIQKITGNDIRPIQPAKAPLIEFIGNSITCGAAADTSEVRCGAGVYHDQHNAYYAYGPRVARKLAVNFILSSVSGIGIYRNWNSDGPAMPQVYEKQDFQENSLIGWDFSRYSPTIVSIALGTNDLSNGDGKTPRLPFDSARFVSNYIRFTTLVKSKYPKAKIVLLNSPMINGSRRMLLENCLAAVKKSIDSLFPADKPVALFFFKPMIAGGCTGHPSVEDHAILAEELAPFLKKLIN